MNLLPTQSNVGMMAGTGTPLQQPQKKSFFAPFGLNMPAGVVESAAHGDGNQSENKNIINRGSSLIPQSLTPKIEYIRNFTFGRRNAGGQVTPSQVEEVKKPINDPVQGSQQQKQRQQMIPNLNRLTMQGRLMRTQQAQRKFRDFDEIETPYLVPEPAPPKLKDIDMIDEEQFLPAQLPSPIYKSDFNFLEDKGGIQYLPQTQQPSQKPQEQQAVVVPSVQIDPILYIPQIEPQAKIPIQESRFTAMQEFEEYLEQEKDLHAFRLEFRSRDEQQMRLESAVQLFEQTKLQKVNDTRSKVLPQIPQSEMSMSSNFFEFQPHLIYFERRPVLPLSIQSISAILPIDSQEAGFLSDLGLGYAFDNTKLHLWRLSNPLNTTQTLPDFTSKLIAIKPLTDQKSQGLLLILTTQEIHLYTVKHNADSTFVLAPYLDPVSTDRTRYFSIYQTKSKQVFIGGDNGKVSELKIDGVSCQANGSTNKASMVLRYLKGKVVGERTKMRKVDKSMSKDEESVLQKIIGNFFEMERKVTRIVTDMVEDETNKCLIVAISDTKSSSDIEFYDLSQEDFRLIRRISLSELFEDLRKRVPLNTSPAQEITKLSMQSNELTIFLGYGPSLTLSLTPSGNQLSYQLLTALTPPFELLIDRYESLFDFEYIPDQLDEYQPWKPLIAKPSFLSNMINLGQQKGDVVDIQVSEDGKIVMLIRDTAIAIGNPKTYLVMFEKNYRRGPLYKYSQYLVGMTELTNCNQTFGLQLSKNVQGRLVIQVLTDIGLQEYLVPDKEDIMLQYLDMLVSFQLRQRPGADQQLVQRVQRDFETYLRGQDTQVSLEALLKIILARSRQNSMSEQFFKNEFTQFFYVNQDKIMSTGLHGGQIMGTLDAHQLRTNLRSVARLVQSHLFTLDKASLTQVSSEHAALALRYFFDLSSTEEHFPCNLVNDRTFLQAYRDYQHYISQKSQQLLETERFTVLYREITEIVRKVWNQKIIKEGDKGQAVPGMTIGETDVTYHKLRIIGKFIQENAAQIQTISVEADYFTPNLGTSIIPRDLKNEVTCLLDLVTRLCQGLEILKVHIYSEKVLKSLTKDLTKSVAKLSLSDFLIQGITNEDVCSLIEQSIIQLDALDIQHVRAQVDFLPPDAVSLFLGKKYLQAAQALKAKKVRDEMALQALKQSAHQEFMKFPLRVNLPMALQNYLQLDMLIEAVTLCMKCIDTVEDIRQLAEITVEEKDELMVNVLKSRQVQQDIAIKAVIDILNEVVLKIETVEGRFKGPMREVAKDSFPDKLRKRLSDSTLSVDYLKDLKTKILKLASRTQSEYFHIQLYDLLLSYGLQLDVKLVQNPSMKNIVKQLNLEPDTLAMTDAQKLNLAKGKLEATYVHYLNANLYDEAFLAIMNHICFQPEGLIKMDINERIIWLQKAEGALQSHRNQILLRKQGTRGIMNESEISEDIVKKLYLYKDYFLVLFKLRDEAKERMSSQKKASKMDPKIVERLSFEIVEPNELCQIAIQLKQWLLYIRILEINELSDYAANGKVQLAFRTKEEYMGTQERIDFMYRALITTSNTLSIVQSDRKYQRLVKHLNQLSEYSKAKGYQVVDLFPVKLIITQLEDKNQETLIALRSDEFYKSLVSWNQLFDAEKKLPPSHSWNLFWHLDLLINDLGILQDLIFDTLFSRLSKSMDPEMYLSLAYLILKHQVSQEQVIRRLNMLQLLDWLIEAISDELLFSKEFIVKVNFVIQKLEALLRPQQIQYPQKAATIIVEDEHQQFIPQQ